MITFNALQNIKIYHHKEEKMQPLFKKSQNKMIPWIFCLILATPFLNGSPADAFLGGKITKFTADQVSIDPDGNLANTSKIYMSDKKMRMDGMPGGPGGQGRNIAMIYRRDKQISYMLNTEKKLYFEGPLDEDQMKQTMKSMKPEEEEKILGTEKVNGFKCTKKQITTTVDFMGFKKKVTNIVWVTKKLDMPIRTQSEDGRITEIRNLKKGAPDDKYFKIPQGYKRAASMMEIMGVDFSERKAKKPAGQETKEKTTKQPFEMPKSLKDLKLPEGLMDKLKKFSLDKKE